MHRRLSAPDIDFDAIRGELGVAEDYGSAAVNEAENAVDRHAADREDRTDIPLVTIDPPGSKDLDQAARIVADPDPTNADGFILDYAIADVAALIAPEGALDAESRRRGTTIYFPDGSVPLHPRVLSEGIGSLLPDVDRPAVLWTIRVDGTGTVVDVAVRRALVRSVARLDYAGVSGDAVAGRLHPSIAALPRFGELRRSAALARGAIELDLPDQEVVADGTGWRLELAPHTPADMWNSQLSLLTGMCAGTMMADAGIGLLRTLPPAPKDAVSELRSAAVALGVPWPAGQLPGQFLAGLDAADPRTLALMSHAGSLLRGAGYRVLAPGEVQPSEDEMVHAAIGGRYAHVTAPLRRLGDRFATEVCLSIATEQAVPEWVSRALPTLPKILRSADSLSASAERACVDLTESVILADRVGQSFDAVVLSGAQEKRPARIFIPDPAVIASCTGSPEQGTRLPVVLTTADPTSRTVEFAPV